MEQREGQPVDDPLKAAEKLGYLAATMDECGDKPDEATAQKLVAVGRTDSKDPKAIEAAKKQKAAFQKGYQRLADRR